MALDTSYGPGQSYALNKSYVPGSVTHFLHSIVLREIHFCLRVYMQLEAVRANATQAFFACLRAAWQH